MTAPDADWGIAGSAIAGETVSGDRALVRAVAGGLLIALVDGAGHGFDAAHAADTAVAAIEGSATCAPEAILQSCHAALQGTRGAALLVAWLDGRARRLDWVGVGEMLGVLLRADPEARPQRHVLLPREGVVGHAIPLCTPSRLQVGLGDLLVLATDGVRDSFVGELKRGEDPSRHARKLLERHRRVADDALLVVLSLHPVAS